MFGRIYISQVGGNVAVWLDQVAEWLCGMCKKKKREKQQTSHVRIRLPSAPFPPSIQHHARTDVRFRLGHWPKRPPQHNRAQQQQAHLSPGFILTFFNEKLTFWLTYMCTVTYTWTTKNKNHE